MTGPLIAAQLALREDGTPYSPLFDDVYHSAVGGIGQALHVFLAGNQLPDNWRRKAVFSIVETGFGLGLNFLVTWSQWRSDPSRCERLHFVSVEKHPFDRNDLRTLLTRLLDSHAELAELARELVCAWPMLTHGVHRLSFDSGRVTLTLALGDAVQILPKLVARADAFYLDGFSPAKNDDLWSPAIFKALARMADVGATFATYTSAGKVKAALTAAGFMFRKVRGYGTKRDMLVGEFAPAYRVRRHEPPARAAWPHRHAIVVGAGLAGCAVAERLASRGWAITLLERRSAPASETSGNPAGVFHPMIARAITPATRLSGTGFLYALRHWKMLTDAAQTLNLDASGLLHLAHDSSEAAALRDAIVAANLPAQFAVAVGKDAASQYAGIPLERGGVWFPCGGWIAPPSLCRAQLNAARTRLNADGHTGLWQAVFGVHIERLVPQHGYWHAFDADGTRIAAAPVAIIANAYDAVRLGQLAHAPVRPARGQLTILPRSTQAALRVPIIGDGYVLPLDEHRLMTGASYDMDDTGLDERRSSHKENLARLRTLAPGLASTLDPAEMQGRVGIRCVVSDRLPMVGPLADEADPLGAGVSRAGARPADLRRRVGLYSAFAYGSRGLIWAAVCAELLASQIDGEPWPFERDLADAIDPARYLLRALRTAAQR